MEVFYQLIVGFEAASQESITLNFYAGDKKQEEKCKMLKQFIQNVDIVNYSYHNTHTYTLYANCNEEKIL